MLMTLEAAADALATRRGLRNRGRASHNCSAFVHEYLAVNGPRAGDGFASFRGSTGLANDTWWTAPWSKKVSGRPRFGRRFESSGDNRPGRTWTERPAAQRAD